MTARTPGTTKTRRFVGPILIALGFVTGVVHLLISLPQRQPHMPALWDAATGYPAAALLFIFGIILTTQPPEAPRRHAPPSTTQTGPHP